MNIAWGSAALLLLMLPGFSTLFGFYTGSRLNGQLRDVTPKSRAGELAMVMLLSLGCHLLAFLFFIGVGMALGHALPTGIDALVSGAGSCSGDWKRQDCLPTQFAGSHLPGVLTAAAYVLGSSLLGYLSGSLFIKMIEREWLPWKIRRFHAWTYDFVIPPRLDEEETGLSPLCSVLRQSGWRAWVREALKRLIKGQPRGNILLTVLTKITYDKGAWFVGYYGYLDQMHLDGDQNIKLVLLRNVYKVFFHLKSESATPPDFSPRDKSGSLATPSMFNTQEPAAPTLLIPADSILNIGRDITIREFAPDPDEISYLEQFLKQSPRPSSPIAMGIAVP